MLSFVNLTTILLLSVYVLDVPVAGSLFWLVVVSLLFIFVSLALGLLISTVTRTQVAAMLVSGLMLMMPTMLLSDMIFPIESMPVILQAISAVLPARWYIQAVRKLMIEGVDVSLCADGGRHTCHDGGIADNGEFQENSSIGLSKERI